MNKKLIPLVLFFAVLCGCPKNGIQARVIEDVKYYTNDYAANITDINAAIKWALEENKYKLNSEDVSGGVFTTTWEPVKSDSHFMPFFGRRDMGVTNSYHQLEIKVVSEDGRTKVKAGSRIKSLVPNLESTGTEEKKVLLSVGDYLRKQEPEVTNFGIDE